MGTVEQNEQAMKWTRWTVLVFMFCGLPIGCLVFGTAPNMERTVAQVPLGSKLAELDELAVSGWDDLSSVYEYQAPGTADSEETQIGRFVRRHLGSFKEWKATDLERNRFTGEVRLLYFSNVIPDDLNPSFVISYYYVNGELKERQAGQLPG